MLSEIEIAVMSWLLAQDHAAGSVYSLHEVDRLGGTVPRPVRVWRREGQGWSIHEVDELSRTVPRPLARVRLEQGEWGLYQVDPLGRDERIRDWLWRAGPGGLEYCHADVSGSGEPRPRSLLAPHAPTGADALFTVDMLGQAHNHPEYMFFDDPRRGGLALCAVDPLGNPLPRPLCVLASRG